MKIWMREIPTVLATFAFTARFFIGGAEKKLAQPERKTLLADSLRPVKKKAAGKLAALEALRKQGAKAFVSVKIYKWHQVNMEGCTRGATRFFSRMYLSSNLRLESQAIPTAIPPAIRNLRNAYPIPGTALSFTFHAHAAKRSYSVNTSQWMR